ncbi:MAG: ABC transporter ATP-binding protein [Candidatus Methanomethylicaceae archaeon]|nr:ABC transporter ATP-binding protein [Candidatus Verstraetearchaeota archaeon]
MRLIQDLSGIRTPNNLESNVILSAEHVSKWYISFKRRKTVALENVNFSIFKGEKVCIIGESGSGKSTLAKILCGLITPNSGEVRFEGKKLSELNKSEKKVFRMRVQYIPQCPDLALDPTWYLYDSLAEPLRIQKICSKQDEFERVKEVCERVGIGMDQLRRKPRNVSGGELQRVVIARAFILSPEIIIADEPTSMLDPSIQAKIVRTILDLQSESNIGIVFLTHDLELAKLVSEKMFVMLGGRIVESGYTRDILKTPLHPYTKSLLMGVPPKTEFKQNSPCGFYGECEIVSEVCCQYPPPESEVYGGRKVRCWRYA